MDIQTQITASNELVLLVAGRIDSNNASEFDAKASELTQMYPDRSNLVIDIENLEYISSAGLRVILKLRKSNVGLKIINASTDIYDIFEMTGFTEIVHIEKAFRRLSVDGCDVIGRGAKGTVYRYNGDTIIKVYRSPDSLPDILKERELARKAFIKGIPTAISYDVVKVGDSYGSVFELLNAKSFSTLIKENPSQIGSLVSEFASMLRQIHSTEVSQNDMPDIKIRVNKWVNSSLPYIGQSSYDKLKKMITDVPDTLTMLHSDYHTNNLMMQNNEALLIDMDTLSYGHPIFELANIFITYVGFGEITPDFVANFIGLPYETCCTIWELFLPAYLQSDDKNYIQSVENKAKVLAYSRYIHHIARRPGAEEEPNKRILLHCVNKIHSLIDSIDSLTF